MSLANRCSWAHVQMACRYELVPFCSGLHDRSLTCFLVQNGSILCWRLLTPIPHCQAVSAWLQPEWASHATHLSTAAG